MATISWQVKPSYVTAGYQGGVIQIDDAREYNIGTKLAAGGGTITEDAGDSRLVAVLDAQPALQRSGSTETPAVASRSVRSLQVLRTDAAPAAEQLAVRKVDGTWEERPVSSVGSTSSVATITRDGSGVITAATDATGTVDTIVRDSNGLASFHENGVARTITRNGAGQIVSVA